MSVETMRIVSTLPPLEDARAASAGKPAATEYPTQAELDAGHIYFAEEAPPDSV